VNFDLTEDELMLKAVTERFVADTYDLERRRAYQAHRQGFSPYNWALLADIGLIAAPFDSAHGGLNATSTDIALIAEVLGKGLVVEPWIDAVLVAGRFFAESAPPALLEQSIAGLVSGTDRFALAHREAGARGSANQISTKAEYRAGQWLLNGRKSVVVAGVEAAGFIVSAHTTEGVRFFLVAAGSPGLAETPYRLIDGSVAVAIDLRNLSVPATHVLNADQQRLATIEAGANLARCAEAVGIMQMLFDTTCDYLRTRKQFGAQLASFQALQHRMVAQYASIEQARALLDRAVVTERDDQPARQRAIAGARAFISDASVTLGHEMIQLHGGMGVADELIIGHGHKRLMMLSRYPDTAASALDVYAGLAA
jgi:alkylation response protein AidB-like acyl-CoA dehydrogenase